MIIALHYLAVAVGGYLLGSVPFGLVLTRAAGLGDIRAIGSGNIGATNVLRTGRKDLAAATLVLDSGKGAIAVLAAGALLGWTSPYAALAGGAAFLGHVFPIWLGFKGGKGVATFLGTVLAMAWPAGLLACATWLVTALVFRISSLSALVATLLTPAYIYIFGAPSAILASAFMTLLVYYRHQDNIRRLLKGEEPKIGAKKKDA
ncbi:MAG: glycerol-3-phosphate 1-O-acyltransferase PlsY [Pseudomonadota bacterium]